MKKIILFLTVLLTLSMSIIYLLEPKISVATECGGVETSIIGCSSKGGEKDIKKSAIWEMLKIVIYVMTAGVTFAAIGGVVYGSVLYTSSGANPETRKKATSIITNTVIGVVAFALMWAVLGFIIPGGIQL